MVVTNVLAKALPTDAIPVFYTRLRVNLERVCCLLVLNLVSSILNSPVFYSPPSKPIIVIVIFELYDVMLVNNDDYYIVIEISVI